MRIRATKITTLKKIILGVFATLFGTVASALPAMAAQNGGTTQGANTTIQVFLVGKYTNGAVTVPLQDGVTAKKDVAAMCHYGQAYAVKWTLAKNGATVNTRTTVMSSTVLQKAGTDTWNIDLETTGAGYGEYTLTCVVEGTGKDTNTTTFKYLPIKVTEQEKKDNNPYLYIERESTIVTKVKFTLKKAGRSDVVIAKELSANDDYITLPMSDYDLPTGTYTLTVEGGNSANGWLGNTYSATISYTKPDGTGVPTDSGQGSGLAATAAAGAVITGASSSKKKRNRN